MKIRLTKRGAKSLLRNKWDALLAGQVEPKTPIIVNPPQTFPSSAARS
jgi:hypothetical protein